ncbi:hypothetical protein C1645_445084 [Glomus cerebriforme]|uniref:WKF domain-containing protein n=1 Tax=Glomus cerebriforme TaxID=658196 RepID=A0A397SGK0_9GLOM|nr:hypothetical protein C1645_445084 [Glomus cerebriforme]
MSTFEQDKASDEIQRRVPKWKKLLSLKNSSSAILEYSSEENKSIKELRDESHIDHHSFKIIEKKRKKDKSEVELSKEEGKNKKDIHKKKIQKVNYDKINDEKDSDCNESENLSEQLPLENKMTDDLNSVLVVEQMKLKIPEEFTHAVKAGLNYLIIWRYHREKWKFQKTRQIWLLKNAYNEELLSEDFFNIFLEYIAELLGHSRNRTFKIARDVVNRFESEQKGDETTDQKDNEKGKEQIKLNRAKAIVRVLS